MTVFESLMFAVSFAALIVAVLSFKLSNTRGEVYFSSGLPRLSVTITSVSITVKYL